MRTAMMLKNAFMGTDMMFKGALMKMDMMFKLRSIDENGHDL